MTFFRKFRLLDLLKPAIALLMLALVPQAQAFDFITWQTERAAGQAVSRYAADDTSIAIRVQYIGSGSSSGFEVDGSGDITLYDGDGVADTTVSTNGVIDVSTAAEDTFGEVVDVINDSDNWFAMTVDVLPSASSNDTITSTTGGKQTTGITSAGGSDLFADISETDSIGLAIGPEGLDGEILDISTLSNQVSSPSGTASHWRSELVYLLTNATFASGSSTLKVYAIEGDGADANEVTLWTQAGSATTVDSTIDLRDALTPIRGARSWRLLAVNEGSAFSAGTMQVHGLTWNE